MWSSPQTSVKLPKGSRVVRKRAPVACVNCRKRKVRCDVARNGSPCSNCRLDDEDCATLSRRRRGFARHHMDDSIESANTANTPSLKTFPDDAYGSVVRQSSNNMSNHPNTTSPEKANNGTLEMDCPSPQTDCHNLGIMPKFLDESQESYSVDEHNTRQTALSSSQAGDQEVLYTHHQPLGKNDFSHLSVRDFKLLEGQGCLHVPTRPILDEFVTQYFLHIHPRLPMIDESEFWKAYMGDNGVCQRISLLLLQAILFSACNCVSEDVILRLGFESSRTARAEFYRRAKLLNDMNAECSLIATTQAALLLSYWTPPGQPRGTRPNLVWLGSAIHHARSQDAHQYQHWSKCHHEAPRRIVWKRVWWCCIVRDCMLSLGLKQPPQITHGMFDVESCEALAISDFENEIENSRVYDSRRKTTLTRIFLTTVDLCVSLFDLQSISLWLEAPEERSQERLMSHWNTVRRMKSSLRIWYDKVGADICLCLPNGCHAAEFQSESVALQVHVMFMYYYSAVICLCHREILLVMMTVPAGSPYESLKSGYTSTLLNELKDTSKDFADCIGELHKLGRIRLLPISIVAFLATPLMHYLMNFDSGGEESDATVTKRSDRLNSMVKAMEIFRCHYDGVEWLSSILRKALQTESFSHVDKEKTAKLVYGPHVSPEAYLHIAFTIDFGLSKSRHAQDSDIPSCLMDLHNLKSDQERSHETIHTLYRGEDTFADPERTETDWQDSLSVSNSADICLETLKDMEDSASTSQVLNNSFDFNFTGEDPPRSGSTCTEENNLALLGALEASSN